jgi:hypothetical protein
MRRAGLGDAAAAQTSGSALVAWLVSNGCTQASVPQVTQFQNDYNASGLGPAITVDGQYGGNTQAALNLALGGTAAAPDNCFNMAVPATPGPDTSSNAAAANTGGGTPVTITGSSADYSSWIIGGAAVLGVGILGAVWWKKHHRGRR